MVNLDVFDDEVLVEMGNQVVAAAGVRIEPQRRLRREDEHVPENPPLDVWHERFAPLSGSEPFDVVRAEVVQKRRPVPSGQLDVRPAGQVEQGGGGRGGTVLVGRRTEVGRGRSALALPAGGLCQLTGAEVVDTHVRYFLQRLSDVGGNLCDLRGQPAVRQGAEAGSRLEW